MELKFEFSKEENNRINEKVEDFCRRMRGRNAYISKNRNAKLDKVFLDRMIGTKGEFFVSRILHYNYGYDFIEPDLTIKPLKKLWEPDLIYPSGQRFYVKTCSLASWYYVGDYSWVFEKIDPVFCTATKQDFIALVFLERFAFNEAEIKFIGPWFLIKNLFQPLKKIEHRETKAALYFRDLPQVNDKYIREGSLSLIR